MQELVFRKSSVRITINHWIMRPDCFQRWWIKLFALLVLSGGMAPLLLAEKTLSANEVMQKAVERARWSATQHDRPNYIYTKITVAEDLDAHGKVKERTEKLYE